MLEQFTKEQIEQIRKELKEHDRKTQKEMLLDDEIKRVENAFPREVYSPQGMYPASEIKLALFMLCDYCTNNFTVKTKSTARHRGAHIVRATCVPDKIAEKYRNVFAAFISVIETWNTPYSVYQPEDQGGK